MSRTLSTNTNTRTPTIVIGATGAVGRELVSILLHRGHTADTLRLFARNPNTLTIDEHALPVRTTDEIEWARDAVVFLCAGSDVSRRLAPIATEHGAIVIDNSSAFRMSDDVPLIVPEVNASVLRPWLDATTGGGVIANPNCSTIIMLVAVEPIRRAFGIERLVVSTYQAASGAGIAGMNELRDATIAWNEGAAFEPAVFPEPYAFNLFVHNSPVNAETGRNEEEQKMIDETRKIWNDPDSRLSATCIRVPVLRAHSEAINVTLSRPASESAFRAALARGEGITIVDDRDSGQFPTPVRASGHDDVFVGHIRPDTSQPSDSSGGERMYHAFDLFACGDQLRKGAALNAAQIAEHLDRVRDQ